MIRKPAVAGIFYEGDSALLEKRIEWCFQHSLGPGKLPKIGKSRSIKGAVAPHAGYVYSGPVAAHSYYKIIEDGFPETFIILCPNHTGMGSGVSLFPEGEWITPLGTVQIDEELAGDLINSGIIDADSTAHSQEHSCEVHIPFLQYFKQDFKIIPISMWMQDLETAQEIANSIIKTTNALKRDVVVIASTDFTHYQPASIALSNDSQVMDAISKMDEKLMYERVANLDVSMCGYGPVATTIITSKLMGATKGEILKYATSGDITEDNSSVVGYGSIVFE
ncbi:MEMO1 family protein [Methanobacterium alcaliphilum]|uniref:MEMO1 family protein n=1 Tax=Methanobacterium alcaliphilum TaxID=392018 RepID=UPI00200A9532|nr:MEMO1 family protein [Methanobacterium alcaliphilum]MCK9151353.1 MEMO1 family protein [Methanobacterium alcaliphilum]